MQAKNLKAICTISFIGLQKILIWWPNHVKTGRNEDDISEGLFLSL